MIATLLLVALGVGVGYLGRADASAQPHDPRTFGAGVDFGLGLACFTMASPIAWDPNYGVLLAAYVVTAAAALQLPTRVGMPVLTGLAASFFLTGSGLYPYFFPFTSTPANLLLSYVFFGAVLLIGCMLVVRFSSGGMHVFRATPRPSASRVVVRSRHTRRHR